MLVKPTVNEKNCYHHLKLKICCPSPFSEICIIYCLQPGIGINNPKKNYLSFALTLSLEKQIKVIIEILEEQLTYWLNGHQLYL